MKKFVGMSLCLISLSCSSPEERDNYWIKYIDSNENLIITILDSNIAGYSEEMIKYKITLTEDEIDFYKDITEPKDLEYYKKHQATSLNKETVGLFIYNDDKTHKTELILYKEDEDEKIHTLVNSFISLQNKTKEEIEEPGA